MAPIASLSSSLLYEHKQQHDVNELIYLFGSLTTDPSRLPPCQDATYKHIMRSDFPAKKMYSMFKIQQPKQQL